MLCVDEWTIRWHNVCMNLFDFQTREDGNDAINSSRSTCCAWVTTEAALFQWPSKQSKTWLSSSTFVLKFYIKIINLKKTFKKNIKYIQQTFLTISKTDSANPLWELWLFFSRNISVTIDMKQARQATCCFIMIWV